MPLENLENCKESFAKISDGLKSFCEAVHTGAGHLSTVCYHSEVLKCVEAFDHDSCKIFQELPDAKPLMLKKQKDKAREALFDLQRLLTKLKVIRKNVVMECSNIMDFIKKESLSSEEMNSPVFIYNDGFDSFADIREKASYLEELIVNEYYWRKDEIYILSSDFTRANKETVPKWQEISQLVALKEDFAKYITT